MATRRYCSFETQSCCRKSKVLALPPDGWALPEIVSASPVLQIAPPTHRRAAPWLVWLPALALLCVVAYALALLVRWVCAGPAFAYDLQVLGNNLIDPDWIDISQAGLLVYAAFLAWSRPSLGRGLFVAAESAFSCLANQRRTAVAIAGLLPMLVRLAVLPVLPVPQPNIADEFGNLLIADTFAHGHIANPTHPL